MALSMWAFVPLMVAAKYILGGRWNETEKGILVGNWRDW